MRVPFLLASSLLPLAVAGVAVPADAQIKETASCKLTNTSRNATLYNGSCKVKQTQSGNNTIFSVKMGNTEPFMFAGRRGSSEWMHGPDRTQFTDLPNGGIFRWRDFVLVVAEN